MISAHFHDAPVRRTRWQGLTWYVGNRLRRRPMLVNLELTKHCNAKCHFCGCWQVESPNELKDYGPVLARLKPVVCSVSGGEPLLRKDFPALLRSMRPHCHFLMMISNGWLVNEESAAKLWEAGLDQLCLSLDYLGPKHDEVRRIPGLFAHIAEIVPRLRAQGYKVALNTIIMESNLDQILPIVHQAKAWDAEVSLSAFCTLKRDEHQGMIRTQRLEQLRLLVAELKHLKRTLKCIKNSDYYFNHLEEYFSKGGIGNCQAGRKWVHVTPDGYLQACSEMPRTTHYSTYSRKQFTPVSCTKCWYSCRGETQAHHLHPRRLIELIRAA